MKIVCKPIRSGKTHDAIDIANKTGAYLVVMNKDEAKRVSSEYELERFPVTFSELVSGKLKGSFVRSIVIDNADELLQMMFRDLKIEAITINKDEAFVK